MPPALLWFRDDLRVHDHPALAAAADCPVVCVYVLDESARPLGGAASWWLAGSLRALGRALQERGGSLVLRRGRAETIIPALAAETGADAVYWNRRYDPAGMAADGATERRLAETGVATRTFQASLLAEPQDVQTRAGTPFGVFTPFWRLVVARGAPRLPVPAPARLAGPLVPSDRLEDWALEPKAPDWAAGLRDAWNRGEAAARQKLEAFLQDGLAGYASLRDRPDLPHTSRLSPHLRFGELSPFQLWHAAKLARDAPRGPRPADADVEKFLAELGWREFCHHLLHHHPDLATRNIQARYDAFPWRDDAAALSAWQRGETGYPLVDAGMRELWTTGFIHNRVRMVAASFLVKHLLIDWRAGERWFFDTLVDADSASNPANWQWVAGCGADAAPYFRIFNPLLQAEKFDPAGDYVRRWAPDSPAPIVEHRAARARALAAFAGLPR